MNKKDSVFTNPKELKNQKIKNDIINNMNDQEAKLALEILASIEKHGEIKRSQIQKIADSLFEEDKI